MVSWLDNWRRDKELAGYMRHMSGLLAGAAGDAPPVSKGSLAVGPAHPEDGDLKGKDRTC